MTGRKKAAPPPIVAALAALLMLFPCAIPARDEPLTEDKLAVQRRFFAQAERGQPYRFPTDANGYFSPPPEEDIPDDKYGDEVRLGRLIFTDTHATRRVTRAAVSVASTAIWTRAASPTPCPCGVPQACTRPIACAAIAMTIWPIASRPVSATA